MRLFRRPALPESESFLHGTRRIAWREYGAGPRAIVLTHGLLMDSRMFTALAPALAARGNRVIAMDMLGHGDSGQPREMTEYSMTQFGQDVLALLEHLKIDQAVLGGTSLGANVALEAAIASPDKVRALVLEMPVLEKAIPAAAAFFVPLAFALRLNQGGMRLLSKLANAIPRTHFVADILIDFIRRDPGSSLAVLDGLTFGRIAPPRDQRLRINKPTLVIGHPADPIHPFGDADATARELPAGRLLKAKSIYEWRVRPERLTRELGDFLDEVWSAEIAPSVVH